MIEVVAAIIIYNGKILCFKRGPHKYTYIGNKYEFPEGHWDCITAIGISEYLIDLKWFLKKSKSSCNKLIFTYNPLKGPFKFIKKFRRKKLGWISHLTELDINLCVKNAGFKKVEHIKPPESKILKIHWYICEN